jgi:peroxiredoxin
VFVGGLVVLGAALVGLGIGLVAFVGWPGGESAAEGPSEGEAESPGAAPVDGAPAPDFSLIGVDGTETRLSDHRGEVVLVNFWATWCGPCVVEMPLLQERFAALRDAGLFVVAVNNDERPDEVEAFSDNAGLSFPVLLDPGAKVQRLYRVLGYPTSVLVGRDGVILAVHMGMLTDAQLDRYLREAGLEL